MRWFPSWPLGSTAYLEIQAALDDRSVCIGYACYLATARTEVGSRIE